MTTPKIDPEILWYQSPFDGRLYASIIVSSFDNTGFYKIRIFNSKFGPEYIASTEGEDLGQFRRELPQHEFYSKENKEV